MSSIPTPWKSETKVNTSENGGSNQFKPVTASLGDGGYVVVWYDSSLVHNPLGHAIVAQKYDAAGHKVGGEVKISQFTNGDQYTPAITAMPDGGVAIAYVDVFTGDADIYVRRYDVNLKLLRTDNIDLGANWTNQPKITAFADNSYVVTYTTGATELATDADIVARVVSSTGTVGAQFDILNETDNRYDSQVATLSNGNFVVAMTDEYLGSATDTDILFRIMTPSGGQVVGPNWVVGADGSASESQPDVAALAGGGFVVVWTDTGADDGDIRATIYNNAGAPNRSDFLVNTTKSGMQFEPNVLALKDGGFLVTWNDGTANATVDRERAQRFDADGNKVGAEFIVRSGPSGDDPETTLLADGRIVYAVQHHNGETGNEDINTSIYDPRTAADFGADGTSDILWRHNDGTVALWTMNGAQVKSNPVVASATVAPTDWHIEDTADFNGDGRADILWRHDSGAVALWQMNGALIAATPTVADAATAPTDWHIQGTGDFNDDGKADILWRHDDGTVALWQMKGAQIASSAVIAGPGLAPNDWHIQGVGDFNGDAKDDILWRNDDGSLALWQMNGAQVASTAFVAGPAQASTDWHVHGVGDFNGDAKDDILWRNDDGSVAVWLMNGSQIASTAILANPSQAPLDWHIEDVLDVNGDGKDDVLWRNDDGSVAAWLMNGLNIAATPTIASAAQAPLDWHIAHHQYDVV
jgi:hypothetical protein